MSQPTLTIDGQTLDVKKFAITYPKPIISSPFVNYFCFPSLHNEMIIASTPMSPFCVAQYYIEKKYIKEVEEYNGEYKVTICVDGQEFTGELKQIYDCLYSTDEYWINWRIERDIL